MKEQQTRREADRQIEKLLEESTPAKRKQIMQGRAEGRLLRRELEKFGNGRGSGG